MTPEPLEQRTMLAGAWSNHDVTYSLHPSAYAELQPAAAEVLATQGDFSRDAVVDIHDVATISNNWGAEGFDIFAVAMVSNNWGRTTNDVIDNDVQLAAAMWDDACGITLRQVPDDGSPLGVFGVPQGDSRFGDIRIAAAELDQIDPAYVAYTNSPTSLGTFGGDIRLDVGRDFSLDPQFGGIDLRSIMIHELGHAIGFGHKGSSSVMYDRYRFYRELFPLDVADSQAVYGVDAAEAAFSELGD